MNNFKTAHPKYSLFLCSILIWVMFRGHKICFQECLSHKMAIWSCKKNIDKPDFWHSFFKFLNRVVNICSWYTQNWRPQNWRPVVNAEVVNIYSYWYAQRLSGRAKTFRWAMSIRQQGFSASVVLIILAIVLVSNINTSTSTSTSSNSIINTSATKYF